MKCGQFIAGLLHECKSNVERVAERAVGSDYDQLHHFISVSPWDAFGVMEEVARKVYATFRTFAIENPNFGFYAKI